MKPWLIGGRRFKAAEDTTAAQDYWVFARIRRAGLANPVMLEGETPEDFAVRLTQEVIAAGEVWELLGGLIVPDLPGGRAIWTPELARETGEFLGFLTSPEDKATLNALLTSVLIGFFEAGLVSVMTSRTFSKAGTAQTSPIGEH